MPRFAPYGIGDCEDASKERAKKFFLVFLSNCHRRFERHSRESDVTPVNLDFDARVPIPFSVFPSSYRSDAVTAEKTKVKVEGKVQLPEDPQRVGREGHEEAHFTATVNTSGPRKEERYYEERISSSDPQIARPGRHSELHIHAEGNRYPQDQRRTEVEFTKQTQHEHYDQPYRRYVDAQINVKDKTYDREFDTTHGPATHYAGSTLDVSERQYRQSTRPLRDQAGVTVDYSAERQYAQPEVRVEATRTTVDPPSKHRRDMGYYDKEGQYHSFRDGLHRAADHILHPIHGPRHHHHSHKDDREEVVVKETTRAATAPRVSVSKTTTVRESDPAPAPVRASANVSYSQAPRYTSASAPRRPAMSGATIQIPCHHIRIGDLVILQGRPCQIIRITTSSQTGQHRYLGVDLFTKQLHEESSFISTPAPSVVVQNMYGPVFKQYRVLDIREDGTVVAMTETGDIKQQVPILDQSNLLDRLTESFDNGRGSVRVLVINDAGRELAVDYKVVHGSRL